MNCNMCDGEMIYHEVNGTHVWSCEDCSNVQFEFYNEKDIENLKKYLIED